MLRKFNYFDVTPVRTLHDPSLHLKKRKSSSVFQIEYAKITESMMLLIKYTHPNITHVFSRLT